MPPLSQQPEDESNDILIDATLETNDKLEDIAQTSDLQVQGIAETNDELNELNRTTDILVEMMAKKMEQVQQVKLVGASIEKIKGEKGDTPVKGKDYYTKEEEETLKKEIKEGLKEEVTPIKGEDYFTDEEITSFKEDIRPIKGEDYFTDEEITDFKQSVTPVKGIDYNDGEDGYTPVKGKDYFDGLPADPKEVAKEIKKDKALLKSLKGKDGSPDTPEQVKSKLLEVGLDYTELKNAPVFKPSSKTVSLTELDDVDLSQATISNGKYVIGGGSGAVDSVNGQTGVVVLDADDIDDSATSHKFVTATDITNLSNLSGTNTGDVSVSGEDYISLTGQAITANPIDLDNLSATGTPDNTTFLRGDNTWATPAGSGDVSKVGTPVNNQVGVWTGDGTIEGDVDLTFDTTTNTLNVGAVGLDGRVQTHAVKSDSSDGILVEASNGTDVGRLGVGNTANVAWYGSHNYDTATQDTIAGFTGAGKTLGSLSTGTYPSLTELSYVKGVTSGIQTQLGNKEDVANKATSFGTVNDTLYPSVQAVKTYADGLVTGLLDYRGGYDASGNVFPSSGGSGTAGAIMKGDMWVISVAGVLGGTAIQVGDSIIANVDTPGQTDANWNKLNSNISYVPEDSANKVTSISGASTDVQYPSAKLLYDQLALKVTANGAITGATKTKVTYDAKGLVTAGDDATTADIADSLNKRYVTDAQLTVIGNTSGTNTGDVTVSDSAEIDFTLTGQQITASLVSGSIDETKLDASVNASLDLADSSIQPNDPITDLNGTAHRVFYSNGSGDITELALGADGTFLKSNGTTSAPSFATPATGGITLALEQDMNGDLQPITGTPSGDIFELDGNDDLQPTEYEYSDLGGNIMVGEDVWDILAGSVVVQTFHAQTLRYGGADSRFDITEPVTDTIRYTYDGTGTNPNINSTTFPIGSIVQISRTGASLNIANCGVFTITGSGTDYFEVTNAAGIAEVDKTGVHITLSKNQTWTKKPNLKYAVIEVQAGGGGAQNASNSTSAGRGGGGGAYSKKTINILNLGSTENVMVGLGGRTNDGNAINGNAGSLSSFGSHCSATGGLGSLTRIGGTATGGDLNISGCDGGFSVSTTTSGKGGDSVLGFGGVGIESAGVGNAGKLYGAGGGGALGSSGQLGGSGANGIVIVTEYY